ncbi:carbohydrate kinase family protein [Lachnospiraceae bacterium 54-53]
MDVCGLGTVAMDVLMQVDRLPGKDGFCTVEKTEYQPGGSGTNVIVQLARLGAACGYIASVSKDKYGLDIMESLALEQVDTGCMAVSEEGITVHTDIVIDKNGDKFILLNMGDVFGRLELNEERLAYIRNARVFYTDLCPGGPAVKAVLDAGSHGVKTVFNMQAGLETMKGLGMTREEILGCLKAVDVFAPCQQGLYDLTETKDLDECCRYLRSYTDGVLLFTLGSRGSVAYDGEGRKYEVPARAIKAVDTTGAGDSYMGGFIYAYYLRNRGLEDAMKFATACAAHTCGGLGARSSPGLEAVEEILLENQEEGGME